MLSRGRGDMLDMADRVGSLESGKDADFIVLSGDPLSVYTHVLETWVEGKKVFDRSIQANGSSKVGGTGRDDRHMHLDCFDGDIAGATKRKIYSCCGCCCSSPRQPI